VATLEELKTARMIVVRGARCPPGEYKDAEVSAAEKAGLARRVARLRPLICIKG
jgi:RNA-splicing ligase RtcB